MRQSPVPWWAAFGAPLVGVPLMVGLLALGSPGSEADARVPVEEAAPLTSEQVEPAPAAEDGWVEMVSGSVTPPGARC